MALNLKTLESFDRSVQVEFPDPKKPGRTAPFQLRVRFKYLDADDYRELMSRKENGESKYSQTEICDRIVEWVNPDDIEGCESGEQAKDLAIRYISVQNAFINDYSECISGFARKNSK